MFWPTVMSRLLPRLHDRANIQIARRAMVISMLIKRAGGRIVIRRPI